MIPVAQDENIIIEAQVESAGAEIRSESGFLLGYRETGEIPLVATVISVGDAVPVDLLGKTVLVPTGRMNNVPDPRVVKGEIKAEAGRKMSVSHWKNIQVVYEDA